MGQPVNLGDPYGVVEFPDSFTPAQIVAEFDSLEEKRLRGAKRARMQTVRQAEINEEQQESHLPERIALGLDASVGAAPIAAGNVLRALVPTRADIEASGQRAPAGFTDEELKPGVGGLPVNLGLNAPTLRYIGRRLVDYGTGRQKAAREEGEQLGGGVSGAIAGSLAETAGVSAQTLPFAAIGMGPVAIAAGLQSYGLTKQQFKEQLQQRNPELSDDEAYRIADGPAALAGAITGGLTRVFGGTERLVNRIVEGRLKVQGVKQLLREANLAGATEFPEEALDTLAQGFIEKAYVNPDKPVSDILNESVMAGLTGYGLGVATGAGIQALPAVAGRVEEAAQESRVRRESREQSRERIRRVIAQRDSEADATTTPPAVPPPVTEAPQAVPPGVQVASPIGTPTVADGAIPAPREQPPSPTPAAPSTGIPSVQLSPQRTLVEQAIADVSGRWQNSPEIQVVDSPDQFPEDVRAEARSRGIDLARIPAVTDARGKVWLAAGAIPDAGRARQLILHEAVGHVGVEAVFGTPQEFGTFMQGVADRHAATPLGLETRRLYGADPVTVGKEIVAKLAENPQADPTLWQQVVATVRSWARRVFNVEISDNDIQVLLKRGRRAVAVSQSEQSSVIGRTRYLLESGGRKLNTKNATVVGPAAFAITAYQGTPHTVDRYSTDKIGTGEGSQVYGWGLYFAELVAVAEDYAYKLGGKRYRAGKETISNTGNPIDGDNPKWLAAQYLYRHGGDRAKAIAYALKNNDDLQVADWVKKLPKGVSEVGGNVYTVTLNAVPEELLDWDKPFSQQSEFVRAAVTPILERQIATTMEARNRILARGTDVFGRPLKPEIVARYRQTPSIATFSGESIYVTIANAFGGNHDASVRTASQHLASLGIKGIRYLDQGSRAGKFVGLKVNMPVTDAQLESIGNVARQNSWEGAFTEQDLAAMLHRGVATPGDEATLRFVERILPGIDVEVIRSTDGGTYNYVVFNDSDIAITHENGQPVPVQEAMGGTRFAVNPESPPPSFFQTRAKVTAATSNPGLRADQIQEAEDLAAVQSSMVTQGMIGWLMGTPADKVERRSQGILDYLLDRAYVSPTPRPLSAFPEVTTEEKRTKELAGAMQLAHYGVDRSVMSKIYERIDVDQGLMNAAVAKIGTTTQAQHKANYLTALFTALTGRHRQYIADLTAAGPASANLEAQWRAALNRAQERLNEQDASPTALRNGLSAIARTIPEALLNNPATTNQDIINWVLQDGALFNVVGQATRDWMTVDDGTGAPALQTYTQLIPDLQTLKDILTNEAAVQADIDSFEAWFRNNANSAKVHSKEYAEKYFKFRTGRDRAVKIVAATEKEIDRLDERIRANIMARDRLDTMMNDPGYVAAVRDAAAKADIVVRSLYGPDGTETGLINRDRTVGSHTFKGPLSGAEYVVDLHPTTGQEQQNRSNLAAFVSEARAWATGNTDSNPLLADEYSSLADYVERHLMSPSLDPKAGFTMTRVRIPFTNIRMPIDPFDGITAATGAIGYSFQTIRDVIERIGGRTVRQAFNDAATLDTVMRKVEAIDANPNYGRAAQTAAVLKALESHGWSPEQFQRWDEQVAEPVFAAAQNRLSPGYEAGDFIVGSDVKLTVADLAAIRLMKQHGDAIIAVSPHSIQERLSDLGISRKAIGNGRYTSHRIAAHWTQQFMKSWKEASDDAAKAKVLSSEEAFRQVVLGYLAEFNPEFAKMDPANANKSPLFLIYRRLADTEKSGVDTFRTWDEVIAFLADELVTRGVSPDLATAQATAQSTLFTEIKEFIEAFDKTVLNYENKDIWGGVPPAVVQAVGTRNAFTTPRGRLVAPSTFYSYSTASESRHRHHLGNLRSLLNLKLLQSMAEATASMEAKKSEFETRVKKLSETISKSAARRMVQKESATERALGNIRYDYRELLTALQAVEQAADNVRRYELATTDHYEHAGVAAANNLFSTVKSSLLSSTQAMTTNFNSGSIFGPALAHWQSGQFGRAMGDLVVQPALMAKTLMKRVAALVEGNPMMSRLLTKHAPLWSDIAASIINASADWRRVQQIAQSAGMVNPYNLGTVLDNMGKLKRSGGRLVNDDPHRLAEWVNAALSLPGVRHATEALKATTPRILDNAINYMMVINWDRETEMLKKVGWAAFKARETAAAGSTDWKNLTEPANVLKPGDIGLRTNKALEWYQQLFVPLGSLDAVLLDYYERTQAMTPEQREDEPLLNDDDHAAMALQYAAKSNVSTETNRPYSLKGKGSDGVWRNVVGTFMGWGINMMHQLSKGLQTHSKDPQFPAIANSMIGIFAIVTLLAAVGAWNWEFGDELTKKLYDVSSARVQLGNIKDWNTALLYAAQAIVNTVPMIGSSIGGLFGVAYTGRGNPFDMTSLSPHIGLVAGVYNTVRRISQTGDASLPLLDFTRQWVPMSKIFLNRVPLVRGLVDQQNAVRSMNASAPPGTEIKWGKRGGGDAKYGPANDEVMKLIASAYEATAHGGDVASVQARMNEAVAAYVAAGRSPADAVKALASALSSKEPVRVLTGREMTPEEERKWVARMTPSQKADYDKATAAWALLGSVTGRDLNMVTQPRAAVGGTIPSRAVGLGGGRAGSRLGSSLGASLGTGGALPSGFASVRSISGGRRRRTGTTRRRRSSIGGRVTRRRLGPRLGRATTRRRRTIGTRRRRYTTA